MSPMQAEITGCLRRNLESGLDACLLDSGFVRPKNSTVYCRELTHAVQKIEVAVEVHPADRSNAAAAVYPWLQVSFEAVNSLALEMVGGDLKLLGGVQGITLREPIEFTSPKGIGARWYVFQQDSVPPIVGELKAFLLQWTIPFLDFYASPTAVCSAYDSEDPRVINTLTQKLFIAAAMLSCGRNRDAMALVNRSFGKPGLRKQYQRVFDYFAGKSQPS